MTVASTRHAASLSIVAMAAIAGRLTLSKLRVEQAKRKTKW
jgi:hypothetical protein